MFCSSHRWFSFSSCLLDPEGEGCFLPCPAVSWTQPSNNMYRYDQQPLHSALGWSESTHREANWPLFSPAPSALYSSNIWADQLSPFLHSDMLRDEKYCMSLYVCPKSKWFIQFGVPNVFLFYHRVNWLIWHVLWLFHIIFNAQQQNRTMYKLNNDPSSEHNNYRKLELIYFREYLIRDFFPG